MSIWIFLAAIFGAGVLGGIVNAFMSDNGFVFPKVTGGIVQPGGIGNAFIGGIAAVVSWGLYGPFAGAAILPSTAHPAGSLVLSALVGAILVGISGARWLSNEADKRLLRAAGIEAAKQAPDASVVAAMTTASPAAAFRAAHAMPADGKA